MKIKTSIILTGLLFTSLSATNVELEIGDFEDRTSYNKIEKVLTSVKEEAIVKDYKQSTTKWKQTNILLRNLIKKKNFKESYVLFKHIDFDINEKEYKNYLTFFQIINKFHSKHMNFARIDKIQDTLLLESIFDEMFSLIEKEEILDEMILDKANIALNEVNVYFLKSDNIKRYKYKILLLNGKYVKSLQMLNSIKTKTMEDKKSQRNINQILYFMQEHFFMNTLKIKHTDFKKYNLLYRTK